MQEINEDELVGFIMRKTAHLSLNFEEVSAILNAEMEFLKEKGIAEEVEEGKTQRPLTNDELKAGERVTIK